MNSSHLQVLRLKSRNQPRNVCSNWSEVIITGDLTGSSKVNLNWLLSTVYISFEIFNFENKVEIDDLEDSNNFKIEIIGHVQLELNSNISTHFWLRPNSDTLKLTLIYNFKLWGGKWCERNVRISWSDSFSMNTKLQWDYEFLDLVGKKWWWIEMRLYWYWKPQISNPQIVIKSWRSQLQSSQKKTLYGNDTNHQN